MDLLAVQRAREMTRERRAALSHEAPLPADTAHLVFLCTRCQTISLDVLGYAGGVPLPGGAPGFCHALPEFVAALTPLFGPIVGAAPAAREACSCGAGPDRAEALLVEFFHAMPGTGAELLLEGVRPAAQGIQPAWRVARVPSDGIAEYITDSPSDEAAVTQAFGRPISLTQLWHQVLEGRAEIALAVAPGQWIFAARHDHPQLKPTIEALLAASPDRRVLGIDGPTLASPAWAWLREWLRNPAYIEHMAGMVIDLSALRHLVALRLRAAGLAVSTKPGGWTLLAHRDQTPWPVELETVAREALRGSLTLFEAAAAAAHATVTRVRDVEAFLEALGTIRPDVRYRVEEMMAFPVRADGKEGRPFNLVLDPFRAYAGPEDLERDLQFHFNELKPYADPARICPCGAALMMASRLIEWPAVEALISAGQTPATLEVITDDKGERQAAVVVTLECDRHVRYLSREELEELETSIDDVPNRVRRDLPFATFAFNATIQLDKESRRALVAHGPKVGSIALHDELAAGLHHALGVPLTTTEAIAWALTPNFLVLLEPEFDVLSEAALIGLAESLDKQATGMPPTILRHRRTVRLNTVPYGRFSRLADEQT